MLTQTQLRALLDERGLAPRKSLGQNFLIDANLLRKLLGAADPQPGDTVLEVGPGAGSLTEPLLDRGVRLIACELDRGLAQLLRDRFADVPQGRFTLIEADILATKRALNPDVLQALGDQPWTMIANLPYQVASPLLLTILTRHPNCRGCYVTIQKEVAQRLMAPPGSRDYGELSVVAQAFADIGRIATAPPGAFFPPPKVTSAMIALHRRPTPATDDPDALLTCCETLFQKRRKQLGAILGRDFPFPDDIDPALRPERLDVDQFVRLAAILKNQRAA